MVAKQQIATIFFNARPMTQARYIRGASEEQSHQGYSRAKSRKSVALRLTAREGGGGGVASGIRVCLGAE